MHIYISSLTMGNWSIRLQGDWAPSSGGPFWLRQSVVNIDEKEEEIYFTSLKESSIERHLYRSSIEIMEKISDQKGVHKINFSNNGNFYLDIHSDASPPTLVLYKNDGKKVHTL